MRVVMPALTTRGEVVFDVVQVQRGVRLELFEGDAVIGGDPAAR